MKHYALNATFLVASACILGGCAGDDNPWQSSTDGGSLRLSLSADGNIAASTRADDTKATIIPAAAESLVLCFGQCGCYCGRPEECVAYRNSRQLNGEHPLYR